MATRLAESFLGLDADLSHLHRRVVRVGAAAAWLAATLFLVGGVVTGDEALLMEAIGPVLAAGLMTTQILIRRESGGVALFGSAFVVMVMYTVSRNPDTLIPAALALVVICALGTLLIETQHVRVIVGLGIFLVLAPHIWRLPPAQAIQIGAVMGLAYVMTSAVFLTIRNATTALNTRFRLLFEGSPSALLEEDWSEALAYLKAEYTGREDRIRPFLLAYPAVVRRAVARSRVIRVNRAAVDLLEAGRPEKLLGYRDADQVNEDNIETFVDALTTLYQGGRSFVHDVMATTFGGRQVWLQIRAEDTSTEAPASTILVGLADVTHIKARQKAMADLVKAKDEFIAKVSHELRTPLTAVLGLTAELTMGEEIGDDEREDLMQLVSAQAQEMSYIVEDLLVASRAEMGTVTIDIKVVDLEAELKAAISGVDILVTELPAYVPEASADPGRVRQILRNLLTNAGRYGGDRIRVMAGALFDKVWIEVRDNGSGVPTQLVTKIFEPYGTAHKGVEGAVGLGLSVSRQLSELMEGSLTYYWDGEESVFRLELPSARDAQRAVASQTAAV